MAEAGAVDFSCLPETAWVNVLQRLTLEDRYKISQTCHSLREHFFHPSVWHTVTIEFTAEGGKKAGLLYRSSQDIHLSKRYQQMIKEFGQYFQDLTLVFYDVITGITEEHQQIIQELGQKCRLQSLTLDVGTAPSTLHGSRDLAMGMKDLESIASIVSSAFRMKFFYLKSWPSFDKVNILNNLMQNDRLTSIEGLNILYRGATESTWATINAPVPDPEDMLKCVQHFTMLNCLSLRSSLLSEEVITTLCQPGRLQLKMLQVMVTYYRHPYHQDKGNHVPDVSSQAWKKLCEISPDFEVHFTLVNRVPYIEKASLMKPEIPVTAICFMKYSECTTTDIQSVMDKYKNTLKKFLNYSDSGNFDNDLICLVTQCKSLTHFSTCGPILRATVIKLAALRGKNWQLFQVKEDMIKLPKHNLYNDNTVIAKTDDGEVIMTQTASQSLMADVNVHDLSVIVSREIGQKWSPLPKTFLEEKISGVEKEFVMSGR